VNDTCPPLKKATVVSSAMDLSPLQRLPYPQSPLPQVTCPERPYLLQVFDGTALSRPPVWMMRQAGRYMHEYQAIRQYYSFLDICKTPEVAVEVTLQPLRAFGFDASIIFSDILIPLEAMGLDLSFTDSQGPSFANPLRSAADVEAFHPVDVQERCGFLADALRMMHRELRGTGIALIGFAGAPWTLASYALEGKSWKTGQVTKALLLEDPRRLHTILQRITAMLIPYLCMQIEAGAEVLQLFDTWAGGVPTRFYQEFVMTYQNQVIEGVRARYPQIPIILFVKNSRGLLTQIEQSPAQALSIDELTDLTEARQVLGSQRILQGNLDSSFLFVQNEALLVAEVQRLLKANQGQPFIFNLGHGVLPQTPCSNVKLVVDTVKAWSPSAAIS
jgi:uroporphyrinogen decarboxylase